MTTIESNNDTIIKDKINIDNNSSVRLYTHTIEPEKFMSKVARVSNPNNQNNPNYSKLLGYCIKNKHWSVFESATMTLEIKTTLDIATQLLRHRSFTFQQLSRRYANNDIAPVSFNIPKLRTPHPKNRQCSIDNLDTKKHDIWVNKINEHINKSKMLYKNMLNDGIASECARCILPQCTNTTIYMTGNCRSWIHYIQLRCGNGTQIEHQNIANMCKDIFKEIFPICYEALNKLNWNV